MTEEEAKQKWCPFARVGWIVYDGLSIARSASVNRFSPHKPATPCIGSECMAWRWEGGNFVSGRRGYCGLAS